MKKYFASFNSGNGSSYSSKPYEYTNKKDAIRDIRQIAEGEVNGMDNCNWTVTDENGLTVAEGGRISGIRFRNI